MLDGGNSNFSEFLSMRRANALDFVDVTHVLGIGNSLPHLVGQLQLKFLERWENRKGVVLFGRGAGKGVRSFGSLAPLPMSQSFPALSALNFSLA
jgi:hypothetical protein